MVMTVNNLMRSPAMRARIAIPLVSVFKTLQTEVLPTFGTNPRRHRVQVAHQAAIYLQATIAFSDGTEVPVYYIPESD